MRAKNVCKKNCGASLAAPPCMVSTTHMTISRNPHGDTHMAISTWRYSHGDTHMTIPARRRSKPSVSLVVRFIFHIGINIYINKKKQPQSLWGCLCFNIYSILIGKSNHILKRSYRSPCPLLYNAARWFAFKAPLFC